MSNGGCNLMKRKKKNLGKKVRINITITPESLNTVDEVAKEMKMTRSGYIEFMLTQMKRAEQLTIGQFVSEVMEDIKIRKKVGD